MKNNWQINKLGEVCDIINGSTPLRSNKEFWSNGDVAWFTVDDIREQGRIIQYTKQKITKKALGKTSARLLPPESVLLCCTASVGEHAITKISLTTNQQFNGLVIKDKKYLDPVFLFYFSSTLKDQLLRLSGKTTIDFVPISRLKEIEIPVPPLAEQKRIVGILDEVFKNIQKVRENTEKNLQNAKELFESYSRDVFLSAQKNSDVKKIGEMCDLATGGTPSRSKKEYFINGKIRWLVSGDIHKKEIFDCEGRITDDGLENSNARYLPINSVMIALNGQGKTRGTVAILRIKATCNQSLVSIYPKNLELIIPEYIYCNLNSRYDELRKITGDAGNERRGLNMPLIRSIKIPVPKLVEQKAIVKKLDELSANIKKLEENYRQKLLGLDELKKSVLKSAFSGEL